MKNALVVDDHERSLALLRTVLEADGYRVVEARNGIEALERARHDAPDIIISDILMPQMDGFALCRECKADEALRRVPFVFYTATYTSRRDEDLARSIGAARFIVKPVEADLFVAMIRDVITEPPGVDAAPPPAPTADETSYYRLYNEVLIHKLEDKLAELEQEVAERRRAQEQLRKLSVAVEQSPALVCLTDLQGNVEYVNSRFTELTGYGLEDVRARNLRLLGSDSLPAADSERLWGAITSGHEWRGELQNRKKSGELYDEAATISPIRDEEGRISHFIKVAEDVTAARRAEAERSALLAELYHSRKIEAIGRLAGGVAHDFNNLLTVILGYGEEALEEIRAEDPLREPVAAIVDAARRGATMTRQLMAFARKEAAAPTVIDLKEAVAAIRPMLLQLIGEDIVFETSFEPDSWHTKIDPAQFDQIVVNLAANARDAMPNGGKLTFATANVTLGEDYHRQHPGARPGEYVLLRVSDTGHGLDARTRERMFEPFFTTKPRGAGTGLGLSTVLGIVEARGGHVAVDSAPGSGTTFSIYLPRCIEPREEAAGEAPGRLTGSETILVIEDDRTVMTLVKRTLQAYGYKVLATADPDQALLLCESGGSIHLLLTDVVMPLMNGKELAERIRRSRPAIQVLFMSGYSTDVAAQRDILDADDHYLQKPFTPRQLVSGVRSVLDRTAGRD